MVAPRRLAQSNFLRSFADRHQHDIDYADRTQSQRDHSHRSQKHVHHVENRAYHLRFLDRIPLVKGILIGSIESVVPGDDLVHIFLRQCARPLCSAGTR